MRSCHRFLALASLSCFVTALDSDSSAAAPVDVRQGLVAYWPLDETADGLTTADLTPLGNHLNLVNMDASNFVPGHRGNAASFNGVDELLSRIYSAGAGNGLPVTPTRHFTVAFWVNGVGATQGGTGTGDRRIFSEGSTISGNPLFNIGTDSAGVATRTNVVDVFIRNDANIVVVSHRKSAGMPLDGTWHHLAWVQNDTVARLYIDGVADATVFDYAATTFTMNTISLGAVQRAAAGSFFAGLLDDVAVWERPLTQTEIQDVMNNGLSTPIPESPPLVIVDPAGATLAQGDNYQMSVVAGGQRPLTYQWLKNDVAIPGATAATYTILNAAFTDSAVYTVQVGNIEGTVTSAVANITVVADPPATLRQGLVSYWPFDEVNDATMSTLDLYSQNNMLLNLMGTLDQVPGNTGLGKALHFDGASQYAQRVGGFPAYNNLMHSISFWVRGSGAAQFDVRVFSEGSSGNNTPLFTFGTQPSPGGAGLRMFIRSDANVTLLNQQTTRPVFDNNWHHVAWVDSNGVAKVYVDGVQDPGNFRYTRGQLTLNITSVGAVLRAAPGNFFSGEIDEVAVWNRLLTYTEVNAIFQNPVPKPVTVIPPQITKQPVGGIDVYEGATVTLSVEAIGTAVQFQWRKDNVDLLNETNSSLVFSPAAVANSGTYTVRVGNSGESVVSDPATVLVRPIENVTTGLIAYWPLDVVDGTTTPDTTLNGNHLTLVNMDSSNLVPGRRGQALTFNGVDELAMRDHSVTPSVGLPIYQWVAFSVALWVNGVGNAQPTTPVNGDRRVFSEGSTTNPAPLFNIGTDNANASASADIFIRDDANAASVSHLKSGTVTFDGNWHHLVYVEDNGKAKLYVDGALDPTAIAYTRTPLTPNNTSIGGIVRAAQGSWFLGMIDDVAVWRRAISAAEVTQVMTRGPVPPLQLQVSRIEVTDTLVTVTFTVPDPISFYCVREADTPETPGDQWTEVSGVTFIGPDGDTLQAQFARGPGAQKFYRIYHCP